VDLAHDALVELAGPVQVGEHLGVASEGDRLVTHLFACTSAGYRGWRWSVTLARAPRAKVPTVCESCLLPGEDAIQAPQWLPWSQRLRPGDVGTADVLPYQYDDERLEFGYEATGKEPSGDDANGHSHADTEADALALYELGLGRRRVLSPRGRSDAAQRWYDGDHGPQADVAVAASATCSSCGFLTLLAGSLRRVFGVCTNEWSPEDGKVVSLDHGCGAHSETDVESVPEHVSIPVLDEVNDENDPSDG
jgi:hypothetical protein